MNELNEETKIEQLRKAIAPQKLAQTEVRDGERQTDRIKRGKNGGKRR